MRTQNRSEIPYLMCLKVEVFFLILIYKIFFNIQNCIKKKKHLHQSKNNEVSPDSQTFFAGRKCTKSHVAKNGVALYDIFFFKKLLTSCEPTNITFSTKKIEIIDRIKLFCKSVSN